MPVEREAAFEIWLNGKRPRSHQPGSLWILSGEEKIDAAQVSPIGDPDSGLMERYE
jgi:hypothetical protein